ncbi:MAG: GNAT family N-acetyltransferase, partial [Methanomicrobiales archaeon HGW-Methanomicrobiales-4]
YRNIRWQGTSQGTHSDDLVTASDLPFSSLLAYDTAHFPAERRSFLYRWINQQEGSALAKVSHDEEVLGYGVIRRCFEGYKIGPIFADDVRIADELFEGLTATVPGETIFFDTPELNPDAVRMATRRGMTEVFGTARMYSGSSPVLPINEIFGVTSFELG